MSTTDTDPTAPVAPTAAGTAAKPKRGPGRPRGSKTRSGSAAPKAPTLNPPAPPKAGRPSNASKLRGSIESTYTAIGALMWFGSLPLKNARLRDAGAAMIKNAGACADALVTWADSNPKVRAALEQFAVTGGAGVVLVAHAPIIAAAFGRDLELPNLSALEGIDLSALAGIDLEAMTANLGDMLKGFGVAA